MMNFLFLDMENSLTWDTQFKDQTIKKFLLLRIEKSPIRMVKSFVENYGKYFDLNVGI